MKIAIQNPQYACYNSWLVVHYYNWYFLKNYTNIFFIHDISIKWYKHLIIWIIKNKINIFNYKWIFSTKTLNKKANILISFSWRPDLNEFCPPKEFNWIKFTHIMDYFCKSKEAFDKLKYNNVKYLLWYTNHGIYDGFFKFIYKDYINKCIWVPFSYSSRFINKEKFNIRKNKCIALWSVNILREPLAKNWELNDVQAFFEKRWEKYFHKFRNLLVVNEKLLENEIDSLLIDKWKNWNYNIVEKYNEYKMFTTCESIMNFPSVKTYEWMACWSVFVASDNPCYDEIWLIDWVNCIKYKQYDINDFKNKINFYQNNPELLEKISINWYKHITENYNPEKIANELHNNIIKIYEKEYTSININSNL